MAAASPERTGSQPPLVDDTLRWVLVVFRLLGWLWMLGLVVATLITDEGAHAGVTVAAVVAAGGWSLLTLGLRTSPMLQTWGFLLVDGGIALAVASASAVAGAEHLFHGGYPMSWVVLAAYAKGMRGALTAGGALSAHQAIIFLAADATVVSTVGNVVFVVFAVVIGPAFDALRANEKLRLDVEQRLADERQERARHEERANLANQLHDSVLQTLHAIRQDADDPSQVRYVARRQERELRRTIDEFRSPYVHSLKARLLATRDEIEDVHRIEVDAVIRDDAEMTEGLASLVDATREALVNAAKHSGEDHVDLYSECVAGVAHVYVRDRGAGFEPDSRDDGGLMYSVRRRVAGAGGSVSVSSRPGAGTEVRLEMPVQS